MLDGADARREALWARRATGRFCSEMNSESTYKYRRILGTSKTEERARWLADGPRMGEIAPDFELTDLDGTTVRLRHLRGRPVVIGFGSYSCPIFSDRVPAMERLGQ